MNWSWWYGCRFRWVLDVDSVAYNLKFNDWYTNLDVQGMDLDSSKYDTSAQTSGTVLYVSSSTTNWNLWGRSWADTFCVNNKPTAIWSLSLTNIHAFLSISASDEIYDMPTNYWYNPLRPIWAIHETTTLLTKIASTWEDFSVYGNRTTSNVTTTIWWSGWYFWTGSYEDLWLNSSYNCGLFSSTSWNWRVGLFGYNWPLYNVVSNTNIWCWSSYKILCVAEVMD